MSEDSHKNIALENVGRLAQFVIANTNGIFTGTQGLFSDAKGLAPSKGGENTKPESVNSALSLLQNTSLIAALQETKTEASTPSGPKPVTKPASESSLPDPRARS